MPRRALREEGNASARVECPRRPCGNWSTGAVTAMEFMFLDAFAFNQPIGGWDTGAVKRTARMFSGTASFDQRSPSGSPSTRVEGRRGLGGPRTPSTGLSAPGTRVRSRICSGCSRRRLPSTSSSASGTSAPARVEYDYRAALRSNSSTRHATERVAQAGSSR